MDDTNDGLEPDTFRYLPFMALFGGVSTLLMHMAARRGPRPRGPLEFLESILATFFITRVVAHERVGAIMREPFVEPVPGADPADSKGDAKQPTGTGVRRAVGELITCTRCLGPWAGAFVTLLDIYAPRHGRTWIRIMALAGANSAANATHAAISSAADRG